MPPTAVLIVYFSSPASLRARRNRPPVAATLNSPAFRGTHSPAREPESDDRRLCDMALQDGSLEADLERGSAEGRC